MDRRLIDGKFIVTLVAMGCVQAALHFKLIDGALYAGLLGATVAGFMALANKPGG